jgi:hypothetical protein
MTYEQFKHLKPSAFKRRCGVQPETLEQMADLLRPQLDRKGKRGGQCKLSVEDQLLLVLEYWREYRTQFHIATTWGLSESAVCRSIGKVETLLMHSGKFRSLGKKQLYQQAVTGAVVVVDITESPIERPKKTARLLQWQEKAAHLESASGGQPSQWANYLHCFWQRSSP